MSSVTGEKWDYSAGPNAVHGKFVAGLPWDALPPPVWEPETVEGELVDDPLAAELRELNENYSATCEELDSAEATVSDLESDKWALEREIREKVAAYTKVSPGAAAALVKELDLPI